MAAPDDENDMTAEDLYKTQAALEGLCFNDSGYLIRLKDMPGESGPPFRLVAADFRSYRSLYFGLGISSDLERELRRLPARDLQNGAPRVNELLYPDGGNALRSEYWTYTWDMARLPPVSPLVQTLSTNDERLRETSSGFFGNEYHQVFAVVTEGTVASAAASSREDSHSAELWVYTSPGARRQGLAKQVVASWLRNIIDRGLIPFYTHTADNLASRRLAESLHFSLSFILSCYQ